MPERQRMTIRLKTLFQQPALFVLAGGINPIGAKMAEALGYDAFYMSGGNTSAHQLGWPDSYPPHQTHLRRLQGTVVHNHRPLAPI